jgi:hypothetical protein
MALYLVCVVRVSVVSSLALAPWLRAHAREVVGATAVVAALSHSWACAVSVLASEATCRASRSAPPGSSVPLAVPGPTAPASGIRVWQVRFPGRFHRGDFFCLRAFRSFVRVDLLCNVIARRILDGAFD